MRFANEIWKLSLKTSECGYAKSQNGHFKGGARGILNDIGDFYDSEIVCDDCDATLAMRLPKNGRADSWSLRGDAQTALSESCSGRRESHEIMSRAVQKMLAEGASEL